MIIIELTSEPFDPIIAFELKIIILCFTRKLFGDGKRSLE